MTKLQSIPRTTGLAILASSLFATTTLAQQNSGEPALEILRQINENPAIAHSLEARNDALLTTGSIVKSNGNDRVLYHLPATLQGMRLSGETASKTWPVRIAQQQLEGSVTLRLAYMNAVSVMPEASNISVEINGVLIGSKPIQSPDRSKALSFRVPNHILVPGYNAVRIFARQRHRVDCSINATHELWTDIDGSKTGLVFGKGNSALNTLDSIAALARNKAGQVGIRLLTTHDRAVGQVEKSMLLAQHTAIYAGFDQAHVDVAASQGRGPGLDIFTGTFSQLRDIAPDYANAAKNIQGLQILSRNGDERIALVLIDNDISRTVNANQFARRLKTLFPKRRMKGSNQGLDVARQQRSKGVSEGEKVSFRELGLQSEEFSGRLYRRAFQINLPSDYFSADYDRAEINLATAYSAGLRSDNKFLIRVNGVTATGFSLGKADGHVFKNKMLRLPLSAFKPGVNSVEVEAQLAKVQDQTCDPAAQIANNKRFAISGKSTIRFPRLAHLAKLPDLAGTVSAGFPYVIGGKAVPTAISVPNPSFPELTAAAGFATQIATKAGVPLDFSLHYGNPPQDARNAIIVGSFAQLPKQIASTIKGIDQAAFQTSWMLNTNRNFALRSGGAGVDFTTTAGISSGGNEFTPHNASPAIVAAPGRTEPTVDVLDTWSKDGAVSTKRDDDRLSFSAQIATLVSSVFGLSKRLDDRTAVISNPDADILLSQQISPNDERGVWTVLTARSNQALRTSATLIANPSIAGRIGGETVTVNAVDRTVTSSITAQNYIQVRGFSLRNMHLVVAGWFSNNHLIYSLLLLGALLGIGVTSTRILKSVGVKVEGDEETNDA